MREVFANGNCYIVSPCMQTSHQNITESGTLAPNFYDFIPRIPPQNHLRILLGSPKFTDL